MDQSWTSRLIGSSSIRQRRRGAHNTCKTVSCALKAAHPETARKVVLLDGAADRAAPLPDSLGEYLDQDCTRLLTEHRSRAIEASQPKAS